MSETGRSPAIPGRPPISISAVITLATVGFRTVSAHGWDAVYTLNGELYRSQWFAAEARARADLATHQDALAAAGWTPVPFSPVTGTSR
jgi:hypothetical protein